MITALYRLLHLLSLLNVPNQWPPVGRPGQPWPHAGRPHQQRRSLPPRRPRTARRRAPHLHAVRSDAGMATAEYAVGTVAAVAFAVVLFKVVQSPAVHSALAAIVTGALRVHM